MLDFRGVEKRRWYPQVILVRHRRPTTTIPVPTHGRKVPDIRRHTDIPVHPPDRGGYIVWKGSPHTDSSEARANAEQKVEELRKTPKYAGERLKPRIIAKPEFPPVLRR